MYFTQFSPFLFIILLFIIGIFFVASYFFSFHSKKERKIFILSQLFLFSSIFFLLLAYFGPHKISGQDSPQEKKSGNHIAFLVDVSESMNTLDIAPESMSRLDVTKDIISQIVDEFPYNNYALSVFAGQAIRVLPFTSDTRLFQTFLKHISQESIVKKGTNLKTALESGISNFSTASGGLLVIFTDGGDGKETLSSYKQTLEKKNISLLIVGVGSEKGGYIPISVDVFGNVRYKMYKGEKVFTKVETKNLSQIASSLGGKYMQIEDRPDLKEIVSSFSKISQNKNGSDDNFESSLRWYFVLVSGIIFCISFSFQIIGRRFF